METKRKRHNIFQVLKAKMKNIDMQVLLIFNPKKVTLERHASTIYATTLIQNFSLVLFFKSQAIECYLIMYFIFNMLFW